MTLSKAPSIFSVKADVVCDFHNLDFIVVLLSTVIYRCIQNECRYKALTLPITSLVFASDFTAGLTGFTGVNGVFPFLSEKG